MAEEGPWEEQLGPPHLDWGRILGWDLWKDPLAERRDDLGSKLIRFLEGAGDLAEEELGTPHLDWGRILGRPCGRPWSGRMEGPVLKAN